MTLAIAETVAVEACRLTGVTIMGLRGKTRARKVTRIRHAVVYAIRRRSRGHYSYPQIARFLRRNDHGTAMNSMAKAEILLARDPAFAVLVDRLMTTPLIRAGILEEQARRARAGEPLVMFDDPLPAPTFVAVSAPPAPVRAPVIVPQFILPAAPRRPARAVVLRPDDLTPNERRTRSSMVRGSARLAKAILECRAAAGSQVPA